MLPALMPRLFRKSEKKVAAEAALQAEIERVRALSVDELAVALLPALGSDGIGQGHTVRVQQLCEYLVRDFPGGGQLKPLQLMPRVRAALEKLEDAELVASVAYERSPVWRITELGETVLAEGTIEQHIGKAG
jgi:hypothetical protein